MQTEIKAQKWTHLGVVAGGGLLPLVLARQASATGKPVSIACLSEFTDQNWGGFSTRDFTRENFATIFSYFKDVGVDAVVFGGQVQRPDFEVFSPEGLEIPAQEKLQNAARQGDDALLRGIITLFENAGFVVLGTEDIAPNLMMPPGPIGNMVVPAHVRSDCRLAREVTLKVGALDIGQCVAVCDGVVLAVEAQEGTAAMLARCAELPLAVRGTVNNRRGIFAKLAKPGQERRIDLPVVGVSTIEDVARAGFAGLVLETGSVILLEPEAIIDAADRLGLFLLGVEAGR